MISLILTTAHPHPAARVRPLTLSIRVAQAVASTVGAVVNALPLRPESPVGRYRVFIVFEAEIPDPAAVHTDAGAPVFDGHTAPASDNLRWVLQKQLAEPLGTAMNDRLHGVTITAIDCQVQPRDRDGSLTPVTFGGSTPAAQSA
jgi:hypothetical protein